MPNPATEFIQNINHAIKLEWENKNPKMRWLQMESLLREIVRNKINKLITAEEALGLINETIAAFTKRGHCDQ